VANGIWLTLTEYSSKYKVSVSTLRRRIKGDRADYEYREGKYFLKDLPLRQHQRDTGSGTQKAPTRQKVSDPSGVEARPEAVADRLNQLDLQEASPSPVLQTANKLLNELKSAYVLILQEKEQQVLQLKEEVADLKTLVRILESENERLKSNAQESAPIDSWLAENIDT